MQGSTKSRRLLALGWLATTAVAAGVIAHSTAAAPQREPKPVTCELRAGDHRLQVRARDLRQRIDVRRRAPGNRDRIRRNVRVERAPAFMTIERRIDEITVIDGTSEPVVFLDEEESAFDFPRDVRSCGGQPTVTNIDSIEIGLGRHSREASLVLDLRFGALAPGFTDEGDGSSEIEVQARLGEGGAFVQATRNPDSIAVTRPPAARLPGPTAVNLNADEPSPDEDLVIGRHAVVAVYGAGGDDTLSSTGGVSFRVGTIQVDLDGGQGADSLTGGRGTEAFSGGPGRDRIDAGAGRDFVFALGRGPDRIDCGRGIDAAFVEGRRHRLHDCEHRFDARTLESVPARRLGAASRLANAALRALRP
jgi:hypothetical protein